MKDHTTVTIAGAKTPLAFGVRFDVELPASTLRGALLDGRAPNGDLLFRLDPDQDGANGGVRRVRPSTIHGIVGSGATDVDLESETVRKAMVPVTFAEETLADAVRLADLMASDFAGDPDAADKVADAVLAAKPLLGFTDGPKAGETATAYLDRAERSLGSAYVGWLGTDVGQAAVRAAGDESSAARKAKPTRKSCATCDAIIEQHDYGHPYGTGCGCLDALEEMHRAHRRKPPKPYAERNQVWRCGTCKTRTRAAFCERGHSPVAAPAGKRRETR